MVRPVYPSPSAVDGAVAPDAAGFTNIHAPTPGTVRNIGDLFAAEPPMQTDGEHMTVRRSPRKRPPERNEVQDASSCQPARRRG